MIFLYEGTCLVFFKTATDTRFSDTSNVHHCTWKFTKIQEGLPVKGSILCVDFTDGGHLLLHLAWCNLLPILRVDQGFWNLFKKRMLIKKSNLGPQVQITLNLIQRFSDVSFHISICTKPFFIWLCMYMYMY